MYSLALLTFEEPLDNVKSKKTSVLISIHRIVLRAFSGMALSHNDDEQSQTAVYFELMGSVKGGREIVLEVLGSFPSIAMKSYNNQPSRLHMSTIDSLDKFLKSNDFSNSLGTFKFVNEFSGLRGHVFPVDCAVYHNDVLVGLLEIDGKDHYKQLVTGEHVLRRVDKLKEFLYRVKYPSIPMYRKNLKKYNALGVEGVGKELAKELLSLAVMPPAVAAAAMATTTTTATKKY